MKSVKVVLLVVSWALFPSIALAFTSPVLQARVNDYANLLSPEKRGILEAKSKALEGKTTAQVVILTVPSLQGVTMGEFTLKTFEAWKLGQKDKNNGLLIAYSPDGDHYRIEVGYGLEGAIPDGKAGEILRRDLRGHANPKAGTRDFDGAFLAAFDAIAMIIEAEYAKDPNGLGRKVVNPLIVVALVVSFLLTCVAGAINPAVGGVAGGFLGGFCGVIGGMSTGWIIALIAIGILVGMAVKALFSGVGGGSSSDWGGGSWASSSGDGGFSGGGGDCGGGGAGD